MPPTSLPQNVQQQVEAFFTSPVTVRIKTRTVAPDGTVLESYQTRTIWCLIAPRNRGTLRGVRDYRAIDDNSVVVYTFKSELTKVDSERIKVGDEIEINGKWLRVSLVYPNTKVYYSFLAEGDKE